MRRTGSSIFPYFALRFCRLLLPFVATRRGRRRLRVLVRPARPSSPSLPSSSSDCRRTGCASTAIFPAKKRALGAEGSPSVTRVSRGEIFAKKLTSACCGVGMLREKVGSRALWWVPARESPERGATIAALRRSSEMTGRRAAIPDCPIPKACQSRCRKRQCQSGSMRARNAPSSRP